MDEVMKKISDYPEVSFIEDMDFSTLQTQMIKDYEEKYREITGRDGTLARADPNRLILYSCALAIYQGYQYSDRAGKMGLLKYSFGIFLDNLAAFKGVSRNEASPSRATARFTLSAALSKAATIPKGTRLKGGELYYETVSQGMIPAGNIYADIPIKCQLLGAQGNGFMPGEIRTLVDPLPYTLKVENLTETSGGANQETDAELSERIFLAPASYSTAGPESAYAYWVQTFNTAIGECRILSEKPGEVDIYVTMADGSIPDDVFISDLSEFLEEKNVRPLTDYVVVKKPEGCPYDIDLTYFISESSGDVEETIKKAVKGACDDYITWQKRIGRDIDPSQLVYRLAGAGARNIDIRSPVFTAVSASEIALAEDVAISYGGLKDD